MLLSSSDKRACMPHPGRARRLFLTFDQGPAQTLPFPAATHQAQRPRGRRITPEARNRIVFSRPSPTIFVFQRLADIAQLADFWIRSVLAREQAPRSSSLRSSRLCRSSTRSGCRGQGSAGATNISILTVSAAAIRSASYTLPGSAPNRLPNEEDILSRARVAFGPVRCPTMSDAQHGRARFVHCLERFSDLARCMLGHRQGVADQGESVP